MNELGNTSDWNEANLKMKRLHDAQERINYYKRNPKAMADGKFYYEWWLKDVDVLLGEGKAKYSPDETKKADKIKYIVTEYLRLFPPHSNYTIGTMSGSKKCFKFDDNKYVKLIGLIETYEDLVKDYNDKHGLSTKNKGTGGMF